MIYPKLVREKECKTDIHVVLYKEEVTEYGEPIIALEKDLKCNYQDIPDISGGTVTVFGETRNIYQGTKARNPDGTVNFTELEIM